MSRFDANAQDLRNLVEEFLLQFRRLDSDVAHGPHVDLSIQEIRVIEHLGDTGPRMMRELAEHLLLAVNSVTSVVDHLENRGLVSRQRSQEDRRVVRVALTDSGQPVYRAAVDEKLALMRRMLGALNEDEQEIFMVLFRKIARAERSTPDNCG